MKGLDFLNDPWATERPRNLAGPVIVVRHGPRGAGRQESRTRQRRWKSCRDGFSCIRIFLFIFLGGVAGCGSGKSEPSEEDRVYEVISGIADAARSEEAFSAFYTDPATAPLDQRADYGRYSYQAPSISIEDDSATAEVQIINPFDDSVLATTTWELRKRGDAWLLHKTELPVD